MSGEGMCWCASDVKCPHGISHKIPLVWEDLEKIIDEVLQNFDRKSIRRFLKKTADGNSNINKISHEAMKAPDDVRSMMEKVRQSDPYINSPEVIGKKRRSDAMEGAESMLSRTSPAQYTDSRSPSIKRPATVAGGMEKSRSSPAINHKGSVGQLPKIQPSSAGFSRDLMSSSLPKLPSRQGLQNPKNAWGESPSHHPPNISSPIGSPTTRPESLSYDQADTDVQQQQQQKSQLQRTNPLYPMQADSIISAGLMRIVDQLARMLLPWQAVLCPRAVETLQDLRLGLIQSKHATFMQQMKAKLEEKVTTFMRKKEEEVDTWLDKEIKTWQEFLANDEIDLTDFIKTDLERLTTRAIAQDSAYRRRELQIANELDDHERDDTRDQLVSFRRIVRAAKNPLPGGGNSLFDQEGKAVEVRVLQDTIAKAQTSINAKAVNNTRTTIRKIEESHDWLCSLADNAMTAAISEEKLKGLYARLDKEKTKSLDNLQNALTNYKEQHHSILEAITVFAGRIHQHASDYLQREQLVTRAFLQYLLGIISGEIKSHTNEQKKNSYAWETKSLTDRQLRKEQGLITEFHHHINPLDRMVNEFKEKMRIQMDHITMKLQSIVNGKENDINARKAMIHRKLAKHVNKACNARRQRLKNATAIRRDEFELESMAMMKVQEICRDLRSSIDSIWVKEHLKERKIYEAAMGRLERLEKSALFIWNKHSHLAIDTKEEYQDWIQKYQKDRDLKIHYHKLALEQDYMTWREDLGIGVKQLSIQLRQSFRYLMKESLVYNIHDSLEQNVLDVQERFDRDHEMMEGLFTSLQEQLQGFITTEHLAIDQFNQEKQQELLYEYQSQMIRLDAAVNRRIGALKDMEADLEETIRLTMLQHEVETNVFEQLSCARLEKFWIEWNSRVQSLARELTHTQEDYEVSKRNGKMKSRINKQDRVIDDLIDVAKETAITTGNNVGANKLKSTAEALNHLATSHPPSSSAGLRKDITSPDSGLEGDLTDTMRIKIILDDIKPELYRDFNHKMTRNLEKVRRDLGEGRKQYVPLYAIAKVVAMNCDRFYEKARLNERCIGRISSQGILLYEEGLPMHAKHKFILGTLMALLAILPVKDYKMDCDDLINQLENMKVYFMIGLLLIINQYHEFGEYFIRSECLWICSILEIPPPEELVMNSLAKGLRESIPDSFEPSGIFSEDPVDVFNTLIELPTDIETVENLTKKYHQQRAAFKQQQFLAQQQAPTFTAGDIQSLSGMESQLTNSLGPDLQQRPSTTGAYDQYNKQSQAIFDDIASYRDQSETLQSLQDKLPLKDRIIFAALLGRPDGSMEYTTHRICQVVSLWRRVSVAMTVMTLSPPSTEYPRIQELVSSHNASISGRKRVETSNIHCISPFEAISSAIDYLTSIQGLPLSCLQAMALISKGGSVDPWLEDPKQSFRHERLISEIQDLVELYNYRIPRSMIHDEFLQLSLPKGIEDLLQTLDLNYSNQLPVEGLRTFLQRDDVNLTNGQVSMIFWSLCRQNEEVDGPTSATAAEGSKGSTEGMDTFQTGGGYRPLVATEFHGDPEQYILRFSEDVDKYLHSMPSIDSNVVLGYVTKVLTNTAAHELVSDAMKLDAAARNPMPSSCCIWLTSRIIHRKDALKALILPGAISNDGNYLIGVAPNAFATNVTVVTSTSGTEKIHLGFLLKLRAFVEVDLLSKYPEIAEIKASDRHYGPQGNDPMVAKPSLSEDFHWKELLHRRIGRLDRVTKSWRETMLSEWAESLYLSRRMRYTQRVSLIQQSVKAYHTQYAGLRDAIINERSGLVSLYHGYETEIQQLIQADYTLIDYHTQFLQRLFTRWISEYEKFWSLVKGMMTHYIQHISSIRRYGIDQILIASNQLRYDLETSCNGLISGYTTDYAQGYFDELILRGEIWRNKLTDLQGKLIILKEHFMFQKDEIDRDVTILITDKLANNRMQTKSHLQLLSDDSTTMLDAVANTRTSYAALQKDANSRLILRIEKAIRESRKLRNAAEQQPEIEEAVRRDIRTVLTQAKKACLQIVETIQESCTKQLHSLDPIRLAHREKMEQRVEQLKSLWQDVEAAVFPLIVDYEKEINKQLQVMNAKALEMINTYSEEETGAIQRKYLTERTLLVESFRKHFREYDLNELSIFERFNTTVENIVKEMLRLWGPSRPKFIMGTLKELQAIVNESLQKSQREIRDSAHVKDETTDIIVLSRMELADCYHFHLAKAYDYVQVIPNRFLQEKEETLQYIDEMSLEKNGDMVRPQVKAVLDLLISGIEINADFTLGYENLVNATKVKTQESFSDLSDFVDRYQSMQYPVSIPQTIHLTKEKIQARKNEVTALLEASQAHMIADHSKLDVLFTAGEKDIEEWTNLTLQLIENAFHNAEVNYLSNLWPTPEPTPRLDEVMVVGEDEDRVGKLKAILAQSMQQSDQPSDENEESALVPYRSPGYNISVNNNNALALAGPTNNLANYTGDLKLLMQHLALTAEEEEEERRMIEAKKAEKARLAEEARLAKLRQEEEEDAKSQVSDLASLTSKAEFKELKTIELQQGWFECHSPEGYTYYHNPVTKESLWDLPQFLKKRKHDDYDDPNAEVPSSETKEEPEKVIDTPRELLVSKGHIYPEDTVPIRIVPEPFKLQSEIDRKMVMSEVTEEARALVALVVNTAIDVTDIIKGRRGRDEGTIASVLGVRYDPEKLRQYQELEDAAVAYTESERSKYFDDLIAKHKGEEDREQAEHEQFLKQETLLLMSLEAEKQQQQVEQHRQALLQEKGVVLTDTENPEETIEKTNAEVDELLLHLGLGSTLDDSQVMDDRQGSPTVAEIVQPQDWLELGLGEAKTKGDLETDSSDGEEYTGFQQKSQRLQSQEELKYLQMKEMDQMHREDKLSISYENYIENENCQLFLSHLQQIMTTKTAREEDKQYLQELSRKIRFVNVMEIFEELTMSWQGIDELIELTIAREAREKQLAEEKKTQEGLQRQQYILEHTEDIQEMMKFFMEQGQLSKILSKKMATELILLKIATPKKIAKIWSRGEIDLQSMFELDQDDYEELEKALWALVQPMNMSMPDLSMTAATTAAAGGGGSAVLHPNAMVMDPNASAHGAFPMMMMTPYGSFMTMGYSPTAGGSFAYDPQYNATNPVNTLPVQQPSPTPSGRNSVQRVASTDSPPGLAQKSFEEYKDADGNFNLDPSWVTEVEEEEDGEGIGRDDSVSEKGERKPLGLPRPGSRQISNHDFKITKDGYKSFRGGWIEGVSEKNEIYYYNIKTGESSWNLPDLVVKEGDVESVGNGSVDDGFLSVAFEEKYQEDLKAGRISPDLGSVGERPSITSPDAVVHGGGGSISSLPPGSVGPVEPQPLTGEGSQVLPLDTMTGTATTEPNDDKHYQQTLDNNYAIVPIDATTSSTEAQQIGYYPTSDPNYDYYHPETNQYDNDPNATMNYDYYDSDPTNQSLVPYDTHEQNLYQNYANNYYDPNDPNTTTYYDPNYGYHQGYDENQAYYQDPNYSSYPYDPNDYYQQQQQPHPMDTTVVPMTEGEEYPSYQTDGQWKLSDAIGEDHIVDYIPPPKPRAIPTYQTLEVVAYAKKEGSERQMILLQTQDRWQNALVKTQQIITEQKTKFLSKRQEMFEKVTKRVENRLTAFVEDIKFMQKTLKKELGDANATERDLRRLFEENQQHQQQLVEQQLSYASLQSQDILRAEKLTFILESLEKFKVSVSEKYESAFKQIEKFAADWELLKMECLQIGDIFDEGIMSNLEQCRLASEHQIKLFVYEQIKQTQQIQKQEIQWFRQGFSRELQRDHNTAMRARDVKRQEQIDYYQYREIQREKLRRAYQGKVMKKQHQQQEEEEEAVDRSFLEKELISMGLPPIDRDEDLLTEEELVMSYLLTQIEMEASLTTDYESILQASKTMAIELQTSIREFDHQEKEGVKEEGSWFNKHRETLERHEQALHITLNKVRNRVNEGYQILQSKLEALDFEVEKAAEEELYQGSIGIENQSTKSSL